MKIKPFGNKLMLDIPETKAGSINVVQGAQIQEQGKVLAVGSNVKDFHKGDVIQFKAWAVDIITIDGQKYYYIDADSDAICGILKEK